MKLISVITPCYNEQTNVRELRNAIREQFAALSQYRAVAAGCNAICHARANRRATAAVRAAASEQAVKSFKETPLDK